MLIKSANTVSDRSPSPTMGIGMHLWMMKANKNSPSIISSQLLLIITTPPP